MSSGLTRGRIPVRVKKTRQIKIIEPASDSIRSGKALDVAFVLAAMMAHETPAHIMQRGNPLGSLGRVPLNTTEFRQQVAISVRFLAPRSKANVPVEIS